MSFTFSDRLCRGEQEFLRLLRAALENIANREEIESGLTRPHPLLLGHLHMGGQLPSDQYLFGLLKLRPRKNRRFNVWANSKGEIYLPGFGTLRAASGEGKYVLKVDGRNSLRVSRSDDELTVVKHRSMQTLTYGGIEVLDVYLPQLNEYVSTVAKQYGATAALTLISKADRALIDSSLRGIRAVSRAIYSDVLKYCRLVVGIDSSTLLPFVDFRFHGAVFLPLNKQSNILSVAESLVHESAHGALNIALCCSQRLFRKARAPNPEDMRSATEALYSAIHGLYVSAKLTHFFGRALKSRQPHFRRQKVGSRLEEVRTDFARLFDLLHENRNISKSGHKLISDIILIADLRRGGNL